MVFKSSFLWKAALSITITDLLGNLGIKSCPTQQLKIVLLILHSKSETVNRDLPINAPITLVLFDGCQSFMP